ncbi:MAG: hypothetical protein OXF64_01780 [bacterium]|nr:hypothetical protein [bacterium]MCY4194896.1 hypothetical protein [bacterium]MCY4273067.1 hypothetical protein [bacterium]
MLAEGSVRGWVPVLAEVWVLAEGSVGARAPVLKPARLAWW